MSLGTSDCTNWEEKYLKFRRFYIRRARRAIYTVKDNITPGEVLRLVNHPSRRQWYLLNGYKVKVTYKAELNRLKLTIIKQDEPAAYKVTVFCSIKTVMLEDDYFSTDTQSTLRGG